jgi:hypothetical protein
MLELQVVVNPAAERRQICSPRRKPWEDELLKIQPRSGGSLAMMRYRVDSQSAFPTADAVAQICRRSAAEGGVTDPRLTC